MHSAYSLLLWFVTCVLLWWYVLHWWCVLPYVSDSKESICNAGDPGLIPGSGRSLEKEMATHSSTLPWRIPWTQEPGGLQSMGSQRVRHYWSDLTCTHTHTHTLSRINHPSDSSPIYCYPHTDLFSLPWIYRNNLNEKQLILLEKLSVRLHAAPLGSCVWS